MRGEERREKGRERTGERRGGEEGSLSFALGKKKISQRLWSVSMHATWQSQNSG